MKILRVLLLVTTLGSLVACDSLRNLVGVGTSPSSARLVYLAPDWPYHVVPAAQVWSALSLHLPPAPTSVSTAINGPDWQDLYEVRFEFPDRQAPTGKQIVTGLLNVHAQPTAFEIVLLTPLGQRLARVRDTLTQTGQIHLESEVVSATRIHGPWLIALWQVIQLDPTTLTSLLAKSDVALVLAQTDDAIAAACPSQLHQVLRPQTAARDAIMLAKIQSCRSGTTGHTEKARIELSQIGVSIDLIRLAPPAQQAEEH